MCFKAPKMPPVVADPELSRQREEVRIQASETRSLEKAARVDSRMAALAGQTGRASLFSGGAGGAGYAAPRARSLFVRA